MRCACAGGRVANRAAGRANCPSRLCSRLLISLVKRKPQMTEEQLKTIADGFVAMVDKCCKQADVDTCFGEEVFPVSFANRTTPPHPTPELRRKLMVPYQPCWFFQTRPPQPTPFSQH